MKEVGGQNVVKFNPIAVQECAHAVHMFIQGVVKHWLIIMGYAVCVAIVRICMQINTHTHTLIHMCTHAHTHQSSRKDLPMGGGGYILEYTEYLRHNLMCFVIQVIIKFLVALVVYNH